MKLGRPGESGASKGEDRFNPPLPGIGNAGKLLMRLIVPADVCNARKLKHREGALVMKL